MSRQMAKSSFLFQPKLLALPLLCLVLATGCDDGDNGDDDLVDCDSVDRIDYLHGNSSGPCTDSDLTVDATGEVSLGHDLLNIVGEGIGAECPDAQTESFTVTPEEAQALIATVCRSYNETYVGAEDCVGAWTHITLFQETTELAATGNIGCGDTLSDALDAISAFQDAL